MFVLHLAVYRIHLAKDRLTTGKVKSLKVPEVTRTFHDFRHTTSQGAAALNEPQSLLVPRCLTGLGISERTDLLA